MEWATELLLFFSGNQFPIHEIIGHHLTSHISKVVKRIIASLFVLQLIHTRPYERNHFAYTPQRQVLDFLGQLVLRCISMFGKR